MNASIHAVAKRYRYTGKERDEESGLYYHGARYYIPWLARWSAVDALEAEYTPWSPYCYVKCNPINDTDSTGMGGDKDTWGQSFTAASFEVGIKLFYNGKQEWGGNIYGGVSATTSTKFISGEGGFRLGINLMGSYKGVNKFHYDVTANWFTGVTLGATWKSNKPTRMGSEFSFSGTGVPSSSTGYTYGVGGVGIFSNKFKGQDINTYMGSQYVKLGFKDLSFNFQHTNDGMVIKEFTRFIVVPPLLGFKNTDWNRTTELDFSVNIKMKNADNLRLFYHASIFTPAPVLIKNSDGNYERDSYKLESLSRINSKTGETESPRQYKVDPKSHGVWFSFNQLGVEASGGGRSASFSYQYGNPQPLWQDARAHDGGYRFPGWNITGEHTNQAKKSFNFQLSQYKF